MRVYIKETELSDSTHSLDALRTQTVQAIAMLNLMLRRWNEPSEEKQLNLSTLLHQIMALISQYGGTTPAEAWDVLVRSGTFSGIDIGLFKNLLQQMGTKDIGLLEQATDGTLLPGPVGERLLESRDIFSVFISPEEYKVIAEGGRAIGQIPGSSPFTPGEMLMLAGRRWRIIEVDVKRRELSVRPARGGSPPLYASQWRPPGDGVVQEMRAVWEDLAIPTYLDTIAKQLLVEARTTYDRLGLRGSFMARRAGQLLLFPWVGEIKLQTLLLALTKANLEPVPLGIAIGIEAEKENELISALVALAGAPPPDPLALAALVKNKEVEKFDCFLGEELLTSAWARGRLDTAVLPTLASKLLMSFGQK